MVDAKDANGPVDDHPHRAEHGPVAAQSGRPVTYQSLPAGACTQMLLVAGLPAPFAALLVDSDLGVSRGELVTASTDLQRPVPFS